MSVDSLWNNSDDDMDIEAQIGEIFGEYQFSEESSYGYESSNTPSPTASKREITDRLNKLYPGTDIGSNYSEEKLAELFVLSTENPYFLHFNGRILDGNVLDQKSYEEICLETGKQLIPSFYYDILKDFKYIYESEWKKGYNLHEEDVTGIFSTELVVSKMIISHWLSLIGVRLNQEDNRYITADTYLCRNSITNLFKKYSMKRYMVKDKTIVRCISLITDSEYYQSVSPLHILKFLYDILVSLLGHKFVLTFRFEFTIPHNQKLITDKLRHVTNGSKWIKLIDCSQHYSFEEIMNNISETNSFVLIIWNVHLLGIYCLEEIMKGILDISSRSLPRVVFGYDSCYTNQRTRYLSETEYTSGIGITDTRFTSIRDAYSYLNYSNDISFSPTFNKPSKFDNLCYFEHRFLSKQCISRSNFDLFNPVIWHDSVYISHVLNFYIECKRSNPFEAQFIVSTKSEKDRLISKYIEKIRSRTKDNNLLNIGVPIILNSKYSFASDINSSPLVAKKIEHNDSHDIVSLARSDGSDVMYYPEDLTCIECEVLEKIKGLYNIVFYYSEHDITKDVFYKLCSLVRHKGNVILICSEEKMKFYHKE